MTSTSRFAAVALSLCAIASAQETKKVSVAVGGAVANGNSLTPAISADGRYVAFWSNATNLVPHDPNSRADIFLLDRQNGKMRCASLTSANQASNDDSFSLCLSADGRFVAFESIASNLVGAGNDTNGFSDIYLRDLVTGQTSIVSHPPGAVESNGNSRHPAISADGRYIAFESDATNFVAGDVNSAPDVFVFDRVLGIVTLESVDTAGVQGDSDSREPAISADGRFLAFSSWAQNLGAPTSPASQNVYYRDRQLHTTSLVSRSAQGVPSNSPCNEIRMSANGTVIAFSSASSNLVPNDTNGAPDVFVWRSSLGFVTREDVASDGSELTDGEVPNLSGDGRYITFATTDPHAVPGDVNGTEDVIERDLELGINWLVSQSTTGVQGNNVSYQNALNFDGTEVAFVSGASNFDGPSFLNWQIFSRGFAPPYQPDLGHRHGASMLVISGSDLSSGTNAQLSLIHAPKNAPGFLFIGLGVQPTFVPVLAGELVTLPLALVLPITTNNDGTFVASIPGGAGPLAFSLQCATTGLSVPGYRYDLSNAVLANLLP